MKIELKHGEAYKYYLLKHLTSPSAVSDYISRCNRVAKHEGDLYTHFIRDQGRTLLHKFTYSLHESRVGVKPRHSIMFKGKKEHKSVYDGTATLLTAVNSYFEFLESIKLELFNAQ